MIGLDSTAIIDLFKKNESIGSLLSSLDEEIAFTQVNYLELMFGLDFNNSKHKIEESYYDKLFNDFTNFDLDILASKKAAEIDKELRKKGAIIDPFDCVIAGIFLQNGVKKIITRNVKHFSRIKEIEVITY